MSTAVANPGQTIEQEQTSLAQQKIASQEMFTALDITREAQIAGYRVRHDDIRHNVHALFNAGQMGSYNRTLANIPGVNEPVFVYYDGAGDPANYRSRWIGVQPGGQPNDPATAPAISIPAVAYSGDDNAGLSAAIATGDYGRDARGRLWVSRPLVMGLNVNPGDTVYAIVDNSAGTIIITSDVNKIGSQQHRSYKVDRHGNVAISRANFVDAGIKDVASVNAAIENGDIVIKKP